MLRHFRFGLGVKRQAVAVRILSYRGIDGATSTIDHIAFEISLADYVSEKEGLVSSGLRVATAEHDWVHWRSLYLTAYLHPLVTIPQQGSQVPLLGEGIQIAGKRSSIVNRSRISRASRRSCFCFRVSAARIFAG